MAEVSSRYARAFVDIVFDSKLDAALVASQLDQFVELFQGSEDLRRAWENPAISADEKRKVLDSIVARIGDVPRPLRNFLAVLIDHQRIVQLPQIVRQFEAEMNHRLGLVEAEVISARPLSDSERQALVAQVAQLTGQQVSAQYSTDATLLGGAVVKLGSTVYDGSVRGQLQKIKQQLVAE